MNSASIFSPAAQNRVLARCVIASLALHAVVLLLPGMRAGDPLSVETSVLTATFAPRIPVEENSEAPRETPVPEKRGTPAPEPLPSMSETAEQEPKTALLKPEPIRPKQELTRQSQETVRAKPKLSERQAEAARPEPVRPAREQVSMQPVRPMPEPTRPQPSRSEDAPPQSDPQARRVTPKSGPPPVSPPAVATPALPEVSSQAGSAATAANSQVEGSKTQEGRRATILAGTETQQTAQAVDTGTLNRYRLALIASAGRYKRYPRQAVDEGWQGKVEVRLVIGANGMTKTTSIKTSSGYEVLDRQALDMVRKAKPLTPVPAALRGREFTVDIPVIFDLRTG